MAKDFDGFGKGLVKFLRDLGKNNDREWFNRNKGRFEEDVREPMLAFVRAMEPRLKKISPHFVASDKKVGGSMMKLNRDVRFSKDKRPYNEYAAVRFRMEGCKGDKPGFYMRITAKDVALGTGLWQPETAMTNRIRTHIVENAAAWKRARNAKAFVETFGDLEGESLKRPPRGFDPEHPLVEDLKRKDFVGFVTWKSSEITADDFIDRVTNAWKSSKPLIKFLCEAIDAPF